MPDIICENCERITSEIRGKRLGMILCPGCSKYRDKPKIQCECGCGELIFSYGVEGKPIKFKRGHATRIRLNGTPLIKIDGYWYIWLPTHPQANKKGFVPHHRLVLEQKLGRYMKPSEQSHHINGIKTDNRPDNLMCLSAKQHGKMHPKK